MDITTWIRGVWRKPQVKWLSGGVVALTVAVFIIAPLVIEEAPEDGEGKLPPVPGVPPASGKSGGLWRPDYTELDGVHLTEYKGNTLQWEFHSPHANAQVIRSQFGGFIVARAMAFKSSEALLHNPEAAVRITSRMSYFHPTRDEWVFVDGQIQKPGVFRSFEILHWYPREYRLEIKAREKVLMRRMLRFWEPDY